MNRLLWIAAVILTLASCSDEVDTSARYVFTGKTITQYLEEKDYYSEYVRLLGKMRVSSFSETTLKQLLAARGHYTVFAPTNDAVQAYLDTLFRGGLIKEPSWEGFTEQSVLDSIEHVIVFNSIIDNGDQSAYDISDFPDDEREFRMANMNNRKLRVFYGKVDLDSISIEGVAAINKSNRGIVLTNGFVHQADGVIAPSDKRLGDKVREWIRQPESGYSVMARLIMACGLEDTLNAYRDETWEELYLTGGVKDLPKHTSVGQAGTIPQHRYFGFTLFAETDRFWEQTLGCKAEEINAERVKNYLQESGLFGYIEGTTYDDDYTNPMNILNQFVTYHLLPERIPVDKLALHYNEKGYNYKVKNAAPTIPVWTHYVTMGKRRLLRIWESLESGGPYLNRFPKLNNGRREDYHERECSEENQGIRLDTDEGSGVIKLINSMIYPIDKPLAYTEHVRNELAKVRLRYDAWELQPEAMNNDMRIMSYFMRYYFSSDPDKQYFDNLTVNSKETNFMLLNGRDQNWPNYQADEVLAEGLYDITITLPPVPKYGIYEIRMGVSTFSGTRGICQVYWGPRKDQLVAQGIPVNMQLGGQDKMLGWERDTDDDDYNAEVDKKMRNNGFMKGPEYIVASAGGRETNRLSATSTRRIIVREPMSPDVTYYLRFKTVQDYLEKQLFVDYLEWCPKEIYDNPETPEDIW